MTNDTNTGDGTLIEFRVYAPNREWLESQIVRLNRRAVKLGSAPIVITWMPREELLPIYEQTEDGRAYVEPRRILGYRRFIFCTVTGETPKFAGWTFAATLEHTPEGNLLRKSPLCKVELDPRFRESGPLCEHCATVRNRRDTFVVVHEDGSQKQVGRDCIRDFLGHTSPETLVGRADLICQLGQAMEHAGDMDGDFGMGGGGAYLRSTVRMLEYCACAIRHHGFISVMRAQEYCAAGGNMTSTAETAAYWMDPPKGLSPSERAKLGRPEDVDIAKATAARAYILDTLGNPTRGTLSDFEHNLLLACRSDYVQPRNAGLLAFVVEYHARETEKSLVRQREAATTISAHYGTPGERLRGVKMAYVRSIGYESKFGPGFFHMFTVEGMVLKWSTGTPMDDAMPGKEYVATFTVKRHGEFNGVKQTEISRAKLEPVKIS